MFAKFFIDRPVVAGVLSIIIVIAGIVGGLALPVAQFPEIVPPTVVVNASYPGASAETLARTVAAPIEERLSGVENLLYFSSSVSSNGEMALTATFDVGTDIDAAVFNVNNRVQLALPRLPEEVRRIGVVVQKRTSDILLLLSLISPDNSRDALYLSNYATITLIEELKRVPGVGDVTQFGARDYSMRIWLRPDRLAQLGLTVSDVASALRAQNAQYAAGKIGAEPAQPGQSLVYTVTAQGRLVEPEQFGEIVLRADPGTGVLRLKDVARIELGAQSYDAFNTLDGKPAVSMAVFLQSGGNALEVANAVKQRLQELKTSFPSGVDALASFDPTRYIEASIEEVSLTFLQAGALVILVVFLFLQNWRATLIPVIAVPISLIGTLAGLWLAGFSINTLTLFGMVLAIGIVVDDAIVVLENVERLMREERLDPWRASVRAMQEVSGAVVAIVLVLCAVFVPVAFLGGIAGQLYRQFAVTVAISVVISGVVALTLTPTLCALLLHADHPAARWAKGFNRAFNAFSEYFLGWVRLALVHRGRALTGFAAIIALTGVLFWRVPESFVPAEDQGQLLGSVQLPDGATLQRTGAVTERVQKMISSSPALDYAIIVNGLDILGGGIKSSAATMFLPLRRWHEREQDAFAVVNEFNGKLRSIREANVFVINPAPIRGLGTAGGFELYVQARAGADAARLAQVLQQFRDQLAADERLVGLNTFFRPSVPQLRVEIDREKALTLGVPVNEVFEALQSTMSALYVNDFNLYGRTFRVQMQAEAPFRNDPEDLGRIYVRSQTSQSMIPLKALMNVAEVVGPEQLERFNGFIAARIIGSGAPGVSSGQALAAVEELARANLPEGFDIAWTGQAFQEKRTGDSSVFAFVFALVMVFLILAALYGRWLLPISVLLAVPFAICGALGLVMLRNTANGLYAGIGAGTYVEMTNDIYFQIGLVVLIGLTAKNAILIVEFAQREFLAGKSAIAAAMEAARLRLRPIIMTSLAFILGVLPLVIATGAGAAARRSMGTGVFGGMLVATFIATVFVPLFFVLVARRGRTLEDATLAQHPAREAPALPASEAK